MKKEETAYIPLDKYEGMKSEIENLKFQNNVLSKLVKAKTVTRVVKDSRKALFVMVDLILFALLVWGCILASKINWF